jgi:hypothetical protein
MFNIFKINLIIEFLQIYMYLLFIQLKLLFINSLLSKFKAYFTLEKSKLSLVKNY